MACFAFVAGTILTAGFLVAGAQMGVQAGMDRLGADLIVIPLDPYARSSGVFLSGQPSTDYFDASVVTEVAQTPGVLRTSPVVYLGTIEQVPWCRYIVQVMGFDPTTDFMIAPLTTPSMSQPLQNGQVIVGHYINASIGTSISIYGHGCLVVGQLEATGFSLDNSVYLTQSDCYAIAADLASTSAPVPLQNGQVSTILVKVDKTIGIDQTLEWISSMNPGVLVFPMSALGRDVADQLSATTQTLYMTVASVILVSLPLVALIATMGANERRREIGLLRAMGATRAYVFRLFFMEAVVLAVVGGLAGILGASIGLVIFQGAVASTLQTGFLLPSLPEVISQVSIALAAAVALAGVAAVWPAYRASAMEPYDAIRRGQN
jgi:putative ABC transport system permease protein